MMASVLLPPREAIDSGSDKNTDGDGDEDFHKSSWGGGCKSGGDSSAQNREPRGGLRGRRGGAFPEWKVAAIVIPEAFEKCLLRMSKREEGREDRPQAMPPSRGGFACTVYADLGGSEAAAFEREWRVQRLRPR